MARKAKTREPKVSAPDLSSQDRKVRYKTLEMEKLLGKEALTAERAKELLGWQEEPEKVNYGKDFLLLDTEGRKIRCENNVTNRPLNRSNYLKLKQEILRGKWRLNAENRIIGKTGAVLNGQHTFIALVLAVQEWEKDPERYPHWKDAPTIETTICYGVDEGDDVVNTLDTTKPRSLADVLYRSAYFASMDNRARLQAARKTDYAIRELWYRTGASLDAFGLIQTHSESVGFLNRHPKLLEAVAHITVEDGDKGLINRYLSPGCSAGLLYLMGCSATDPTEYSAKENPDESSLDFSRWDKACDFWVLLAQKADEVSAVAEELAKIIEEDGGSKLEREALLVKAWNLCIEGKPVTTKFIALNYEHDEEGFAYLDDLPTVGGIDLGEPGETDEEDIHMVDPTPQEIKERKETAKQKLAANNLKPKRKGNVWANNDVAWITEDDGEQYLGKLIEAPYECEDGGSRVTVKSSTGEWEVKLSQLSLDKPEVTAKTPKPAKPKTTKSKSKSASSKVWNPSGGKVCWVTTNGEDPYRCRIMEVLGKNAKVKILQGFPGTGNVVAVRVVDLQEKQPGKPQPTM